MLKKEYAILEPFARKPWRRFTFREVKDFSGKKSGSYVYGILKKFAGENILKEERAGNVVLYSLNLASAKSRIYAGTVAEYVAWNKKRIPYGGLENIIRKIPSGFFIFIITGSYAEGAQRKDSDIDIVIVCEDCVDAKSVYAEIRHDCEMSIPQIHPYVFRKNEFLGMLLEKKANYGKETAGKNLILMGGEEYYGIVKEAVENGFNG